MRTPQRPLQLLDPLLLLGIGPRGCASPPKRSLGSRFYFVLPTVIEIRSNLVLTAGLSHVPALQTFQHNLPFLFRGSLDSRLSRHSRLLAEAPSLTNFRVQFYWGALHLRYLESVLTTTLQGSLRALNPSITARISIRLLVV